MDRVERLSRVLGYDCEVEDERLEALAEAGGTNPQLKEYMRVRAALIEVATSRHR